MDHRVERDLLHRWAKSEVHSNVVLRSPTFPYHGFDEMIERYSAECGTIDPATASKESNVKPSVLARLFPVRPLSLKGSSASDTSTSLHEVERRLETVARMDQWPKEQSSMQTIWEADDSRSSNESIPNAWTAKRLSEKYDVDAAKVQQCDNNQLRSEVVLLREQVALLVRSLDDEKKRRASEQTRMQQRILELQALIRSNMPEHQKAQEKNLQSCTPCSKTKPKTPHRHHGRTAGGQGVLRNSRSHLIFDSNQEHETPVSDVEKPRR